jgi:Tol biopolymer transport system component
MQMRRSVPAIIAAFASVSLTFGWASTAGAVVPGQNAKIAFTGNQDGDDEIYTVDPDGSGRTQLTHNATTDGAAAWSPDGNRIAFVSYRDGNYEIYVMGADGSSPTRLTNAAGFDSDPAWSPDGQRIAFNSERDGNVEIYVMGADGSNPMRLTNNAAFDSQPGWSPDGQRIAFVSDRAPYGPDYEIYVMGADGSNPTHLTTNARSDLDPAWSPDGQRMTFSTNRDGNVLDFDIYVMGADGSNQTHLTTNHGFNRTPAFSPDGQRIVFNGDRPDGTKLRVINADGSGEMVVPGAAPGARETDPDWQAAPIVAPPAAPPAAAQQPAASSPVSSPGAVPVVADRRPSSRIALKARVAATRSWRTIAGTATDDHAIRRVKLSVVRRSIVAGRLRCRALTARGRWRTYRPAGRSCRPRFLLTARGTTKWSLRLKRRLPNGRYVITSRATDNAGQREIGFSTALGNLRKLRAR